METLANLFNNMYFRIPDYQRGYAWAEKQLQELWDDIDEIQGNIPHYTGTIFVEEMKREDIPSTERWMKDDLDGKFYNVVDGQQRLTTISILLFELLKAEDSDYNQTKIVDLKKQYIVKSNASENSRVYHFSYIGEQNEYLLSNIFEDDKIVVKNQNQTAYTQNLLKAKQFFAEKIKELSKENRNILFKKVTTLLKFDLKEIENNLDVQTVFETMNNRGKPLTVLEKLKNRLIYLTEKLPNREEDRKNLRKNINNAWGKIYTELAQNPENVLDEDEFLSAHLSLYKKPDYYVFSETETEDKVFKMFCNKAEKYNESRVDFDLINDYVRDLSDFVSYWYKANNPDDNIWLQKIYLLEAIKEIKIYISVLMKANNGNSIENDLKILEKILFRNKTPGLYFLDIRTFASLARDLYEPFKNKEPENKQLETLQNIREQLRDELRKPVDVERMVGAFSYLFTYVRGKIGYHRWNALEYLLFEYEEYLHGKDYSQDAQKFLVSDFKSFDIEHIMPQNTEYWEKEIDDFLINFKEEQKYFASNIIINTLGNLAILKDSKNSSVSNNPWVSTPEKEGKKERYATGSFSEIQISQNDSWNKHTILARGKEILAFLLKEKLGVTEPLSEEFLETALFYSPEYYRIGFSESESR